jgi:hypothetical protein
MAGVVHCRWRWLGVTLWAAGIIAAQHGGPQASLRHNMVGGGGDVVHAHPLGRGGTRGDRQTAMGVYSMGTRVQGRWRHKDKKSKSKLG